MATATNQQNDDAMNSAPINTGRGDIDCVLGSTSINIGFGNYGPETHDIESTDPESNLIS